MKLDNTFKFIFDLIDEAIFICDSQTDVVLDVNQSMLDMFGYRKDEFVGKSPKDLELLNGGIDRNNMPEEVLNVLKGKEKFVELEAKRKDGTLFCSETSIKKVTVNNQNYIIYIVRNISSKKETILKVRKVLDFQKILSDISTRFISLPIYEFNTTIDYALKELGEYFKADRAYVFEYSKTYEFVSNTNEWCNLGIESKKKLFTNHPTDNFLWYHSHLLNSECLSVSNTTKLEGDAHYVGNYFNGLGIKSFFVAPIVQIQKVIGFIGIDFNNDYHIFNKDDENAIITFGNIIAQAFMRKNHVRSILKAKEKAEESDRLKSTFLSNMSHEIRTPLNAIVGFSDLLTNFKLTEEEKINYASLISESSNLLLNLINDIIDVSKVEAGKIVINYTKLNVAKILNSALAIFNTQAKNKNISFELIINQNAVNTEVAADEVKLLQIFNNLISNAVKYSNEGIITIKLSVDSNEIRFSIADQGIGISEENLKNIFYRFIREENKDTHKAGGTGLGLSITKGYIDKMGGQIYVKSERGKGSEFSFVIPADIKLIDPSNKW